MSSQITAVALAKMLNITRQRVYQLVKEGVISEPKTRGKFSLESVQQYVAFIQARTPEPSEGKIDFHAEKARLTKAQADMAELELAKKRGDVAPVEDFERETSAIMTAIRVNMRNIPQRTVTQLLGETDETRFKAVLMSEINLALETAADADIELDDE